MSTKTPRATAKASTSATPTRAAKATKATKAAAPAKAAASAKPALTGKAANAVKATETAKEVRTARASIVTKSAQAAKAAKTRPQPQAQAEPARKPRAPRKRAAAVAPPPAATALGDTAVAVAVAIEAPADGAVFGAYEVRMPDEEPATVSLRDATPGSAHCSCLDFMLSEDADCPHLQVLLPRLQADPARAQALAQGPQRPGSRVVLGHGARRRPLWLPGTDCPQALDVLARKALQAEPAAIDEPVLASVLRAARDVGHDVQVEDEVWEQLAIVRDMRARVQRLEALFEQGPAGAELQGAIAVTGAGTGEDGPLLPLQLEGALFAVCAGRSILADAAALQPMRQALAAALLWRRHFGLERVLVLAPASRLPLWQRALSEQGQGFTLSALENVAQDGPRLRAAEPELVIVHEDDSGLWIDPERAAALLRLPAAFAIVLPEADWLQRAAELPLRVAFVDAHRLGGYASLLQAHGKRDEDGALCGLHDLDGLRQTLAALLLARTLDEVRSQLPERVEAVRRVPMPESVQREHEARCTALAATVARWREVGWLPDGQQRRLVAQVQALRRLCAGAGAPAVAAAKAQALRRLLDEGEAPVAKAVVFSQWPPALQAVQAALTADGVDAVRWCSDDAAPLREAALQRFRDERGCRVLLLADPGSSALELRVPQAQVVHLDRPWNPRVLSRRFGRVHRRGKAQLVPVVQLLLQHSFEDASLQVLAGRREPPVTEVLDALSEEGFAQGAACTQWLADLHAVLQCGRSLQAPAAPAHS